MPLARVEARTGSTTLELHQFPRTRIGTVQCIMQLCAEGWFCTLVQPAARMRSEGYSTWVCVSFVRSSVKSHLTSQMSNRAINERAYLVAYECQKIVGICLKRLRSRVVPRNTSEKANMLILPVIYPRSAFFTRCIAKRQRLPRDCQRYSALPKTMPTDAASPCWSEN